ncbi:hypothetical protein OS176_03660 [Xanthomonadaceae bacterium XH05]|nr:hypothetical protein [Xanthomonadaceae bacterium XH05]
MSANQMPSATNDSSTLYASVDGRMAGLGAGEAVFFETRSGRSHVMTGDVARAFELCRAFLPMAEHVTRIMEALPSLKGQGAAVQRVLEMFVARGLMQTDTQFIARFAAATSSTQAPVSGVFLCAPVVSGQLRLMLEGLRTHAQRFGLAWPVYVVDLNGDAALASEHATALAGFVRDTGIRLRHVTANDVARIVDALVAELPEQADAVRWLFTPVPGSTGAARNLVALLAAGTRYLFLDSDTALPLLRHPEFSRGLYADGRALAVRSFESAQSAQAAGVASEADPLAEHLALCGLTLGEACAMQPDAMPQRDNLRGVIAARAPWLRPEHRVSFTAVGRVGQFAPADPTLPFQLAADERAGMVATRETYLATYRTPALWQGTSHFAAGLGDGLAPLAFDASRMVPCTLPGARSASQLQVELLRLAHPDGVDLDFPFALMQIAPGVGADDALGRPDSAQCLAGLAAHVAQDVYAADPAHRLGVLAAKLEDMAAASDSTLNTYLVEYLAYHRSSVVERMQQAFAGTASPPVYWLADLRAAVEAQGKALAGGEVPRLAGWPVDADGAACVAAFRNELRGLAAGLRAWPAAFAIARSQSAAWRDALSA